MKAIQGMSDQERTRREDAVQFARNSVRLEGFILGDDAEALFARYINGEMTRPQLNDAVRKMAGYGPPR